MSGSDQKIFAPSAHRNREPILNELRKLVSSGEVILEVGSGTGQHACFFAKQLPQITWQPTELAPLLPVIQEWLDDEGSSNIREPLELDVADEMWAVGAADFIYTCNTFHIMPLASVAHVFRGARRILAAGQKLAVYGPFSFNGEHTAASNQQFDLQLRSANSDQGIREMNWLNELATAAGFTEAEVIAMPVNNFLSIWQRQSN